MTSPVIEAMGRAMCAFAGNDPDSTVGRLNSQTGVYDPLWQAYSPMAEVFLKALEENITDEMLIVAQGEMFEKTGSAPPSTAIAIGFTAMLRAAREE